ncbi:hypothetical protein KFL_008180010, partial [Klebsormidium nitens]
NPAYSIGALSICFNLNASLSGVTFGVATASSTRIAVALGANKPHVARAASKAFIAVGVALGAAIAAALAAFRRHFIAALTSEPETACLAAQVISLQSYDTRRKSRRGFCAGARGRTSCSSSLITQYPLGIAASGALGGLGVCGLWLGMVIADVAAQLTSEVTLVWKTDWEDLAAKVPFALYHLIAILTTSFLFVMAYQFVFVAGYLGCVPVLLPTLGFQSLRELANVLADPLGNDDTDIPVFDYVLEWHTTMESMINLPREKESVSP